MDDDTRRSLAGIAIAVVVGALVAWAGSDGSAQMESIPVFALCGLLAYLINWVAYIPSAVARTERFYDITGSVTYLAVTAVAVALSDDLDARAWLVASLVGIWTIRLGTFLFRRVRRAGDSRFDDIKGDRLRFLMTWTLQGLWVLLTAAAALAIITGTRREPIGVIGVIGALIWLVGFAFEVVADRQKSKFKQDPENDGRFINTGLWAWSRHPNYFGEITLWAGIALLAVPVLSGWQWVTLVSPVFVYLLITRISGIPMLEKKADERWGDEPEYQRYKSATPVLVPRPPG